jgi:hypothetical protein
MVSNELLHAGRLWGRVAALMGKRWSKAEGIDNGDIGAQAEGIDIWVIVGGVSMLVVMIRGMLSSDGMCAMLFRMQYIQSYSTVMFELCSNFVCLCSLL